MGMRHIWQCAIALVLAFSLAARFVEAEDTKPKKKDEKSTPNAETIQKWMQLAAPGKEHRALSPFVGKWNTVSKFWMAGPDAPPSVSKGEAELKYIMGGRFLSQDASGQMFGQKFTGMGIIGYDNFKKKFTSMWIDSAGTAMYTSEGTKSKDGATFTFHGKMDDPVTGQRDSKVKTVWRIVNKDKHVFTMFGTKDGKEVTMGELIYTRKNK